MSVSDDLERRLRAGLDPEMIEIVDESERHRGHAGYREGGESHFRLTIRAAVLDGVGRVEKHRAIHSAIGPELMARIHALAIHVVAPDQRDPDVGTN